MLKNKLYFNLLIKKVFVTPTFNRNFHMKLHQINIVKIRYIRMPGYLIRMFVTLWIYFLHIVRSILYKTDLVYLSRTAHFLWKTFIVRTGIIYMNFVTTGTPTKVYLSRLDSYRRTMRGNSALTHDLSSLRPLQNQMRQHYYQLSFQLFVLMPI